MRTGGSAVRAISTASLWMQHRSPEWDIAIVTSMRPGEVKEILHLNDTALENAGGIVNGEVEMKGPHPMVTTERMDVTGQPIVAMLLVAQQPPTACRAVWHQVSDLGIQVSTGKLLHDATATVRIALTVNAIALLVSVTAHPVNAGATMDAARTGVTACRTHGSALEASI